jgi:hypothetical protein
MSPASTRPWTRPSNAPRMFHFLGARLLGNPLEALASVLPARLFEDIERTTPFKFAQDIIESQIAVYFLNSIDNRSLLLWSFLITFFVPGISPICHRLVQFFRAYTHQPQYRNHSPSPNQPARAHRGVPRRSHRQSDSRTAQLKGEV